MRSLRQIIESINHTLKDKLSMGHHGGHTKQGVAVRITQRLLALSAAIWHNHHAGQPVLRSLNATTTDCPLGIGHLEGLLGVHAESVPSCGSLLEVSPTVVARAHSEGLNEHQAGRWSILVGHQPGLAWRDGWWRAYEARRSQAARCA